MPGKRKHDALARELARELCLDERLVLLGSRLPDFDLIIGRHRKTLHGVRGLILSLITPDTFIGFASHVGLDALSPLFRLKRRLEGILEDVLA